MQRPWQTDQPIKRTKLTDNMVTFYKKLRKFKTLI